MSTPSTRPLRWLRDAAVFASRGSIAAAAHSRAVTRIAGAEFGAAGSRGETFPGCKALKSHEMGMESADVTRIGGRGCWRHAPAGSRSWISRGSKTTVDELMHGEADAKIFSLA